MVDLMWLWAKPLVAEKIASLKHRVKAHMDQYGRAPKFVVLRVGDDAASRVYVNHKLKRASEVGINAEECWLPDTIDEPTIQKRIRALNDDPSVDGFIVQLPLPNHVNWQHVIDEIDPVKDADGFTAFNLGKLFCGYPFVVPATPKGIMELLKYYGVGLDGVRAVVVGRSRIVGRPMAALLEQQNATVTICHSHTPPDVLLELCQEADVVVCAVGKAGFVTPDMVKRGAVVIDVGINRTSDGKIVGDVDPHVEEKAKVTPVPGGVGPMTVISLLENVMELAEKRKKEEEVGHHR